MRVHFSPVPTNAPRTVARIAAALIALSAVLTPLILTACHSGDATGTNITAATNLTKLGTDPTSVVAGASFSDSIRVRVTDASNNPKSGVSVAFAVAVGGGSVTPATAITDANGRAAAKFITGTTAGTNTATATVTGLTAVTFSTAGVAGPANSLVKIGTDPTGVVPGASFSDSIRVQVTDGSNNPKSGVSVAFAVAVGGGTVTPATAITDANGRAAAKFITGTTVGTNTATATVTGLTPLTFSVTTIAAMTWSIVPSGTTQTLRSIWGTSPSDVWAVGSNGTILHYNGTIWSSASSGTTEWLYGVWGTSASDVWAVGDNGTIIHYNGTSWSGVFNGGTLQNLSSVWGSSATDVWAVGDNGTMHYNGTTWSIVSNPPDLNGVWGTSASDVWAVDISGTIFHYNGTTWSSISSGTALGLYSVWGTSASDVWAVGSAGTGYAGGAGSTILHYNGTTWSSVSLGTTEFPYSVWGTSASDVWAVGIDVVVEPDVGGDVLVRTAAILHYNGTFWLSVPSGTTQTLNGIWGTSASDVWAVGDNGTILHGPPAG